MRLWAAYVFKRKWYNIVGGSNTVAYLLCQWGSGNAQLDEYNKPEYVEVKLSLLITSDSKHLKIGVRTNPSGYLYILQKGDRNYWHYNFTYQIIFEGK